MYQVPTAIASLFAVPMPRPRSIDAGPWNEDVRPRHLQFKAAGLSPWMLLVLGSYVALLAILIPRHEPWFDEAQAWLLARDATPWQLVTHLLRYEGNPGLWHFLLMPFAKQGFPYVTLNIIGGVFGAAGVYVFLRCAPFPPFVKLLVPFTYFIFFQYAVVSRSYVMAPLFLFAVAATYQRRFTNVYPFMASLMLLSLVSVHGMLIAGSLAMLQAWELRERWAALASSERRAQLVALAAFIMLAIALTAILWPASDDAAVHPGLNFNLAHVRMSIIGIMNRSLTENHFVSPLVLLVSLWWFWRRKVLLLYLLPTTAFLLFAAVKYYSPWHEGFIFLIWLFAMWISFTNRVPYGRLEERAKFVVTGTMLVVLTFHVMWSFNASRYDFREPYTGARAVAAYIKANHLETAKIYATNFSSVAILPYFSRNIFDNYHHKQNPSYWDFSSGNHIVQDLEPVYDARPDVIIIGVKRPRMAPLLTFTNLFPGYRYVGDFYGALYWKTGPLELDAYAMWRKISS